MATLPLSPPSVQPGGRPARAGIPWYARPFRRAGALRAASLVWLLAVLAAAGAALGRGVGAEAIAPYAIAATLPALLSLALSPRLDREWAQLAVILGWTALAIVACLAVAFVPMAILFLTAPAAAALFEREKVVEALVIGAVFAGAIYYFGARDLLPAGAAAPDAGLWSAQAGIVATVMFLVTAMMGA